MNTIKSFGIGICILGLASCSSKINSPKMDNTLTEREKKNGWTLLFDGKTSGDWRSYNGKTFPKGWVVEDGTLKSLGTASGDTGGDIIYGAEQFGNFELSIDWKISPGGNSGIIYHVVENAKYKGPYETGPEYQLIDDIGYPGKLEDWQKVGNDYAMYNAPTDKNLKPAGEWNNSRIVWTTDKVEYYLNGKRTVRFVPYSEDWTKRRNSGKWEQYPDYAISKTGYIALQDHGSFIWFKNIKIKKL